MNTTRPGFQHVQYGFAAYIRNPEHQPMPANIAPERMQMYRELFFNNIENFLSAGFPVLKSLLPAEHWLALVQDFFNRHQSHTPLFVGIPEEFLDYLARERTAQPHDPAFLLELAHYEWVELALEVSELEPPPHHPAPLSSLPGHTVYLSGVAWPLAYQFPVHQLGPGFQPTEPPATPTYLLVYRNRDDAVKFMTLNPASYRLLEMLETGEPEPLESHLLRLAEELAMPEPHGIFHFACDLVCDWAERGIVGLDTTH
mgnify:CR=1 FL=1